MTSKDFYKALQKRKAVFEEHGFKKIGHSKFKLDDKNILNFQMDKWGWEPEYGTGFLIRVSSGDEKYNPFLNEFDIKPQELLETGRINAHDFKRLYDSHKRLTDRHIVGFFSYYDEDHLEALLDLVLEPILLEVKERRFR